MRTIDKIRVDEFREFLNNCARFSNAHICNNLNATAEVDPGTWAEFDVHVHEAETWVDNLLADLAERDDDIKKLRMEIGCYEDERSDR